MRKPQRETFRSEFEWLVAVDLYERKVPFEYEVVELPANQDVYKGMCQTCGSTKVSSVRRYTPDFLLPGGILVETKGKFSSQNRTKMLAVKESNPDEDIRMLFMRNNYLTKKKAGTYGDWCDRNGFKWAVGRVPEEWLNE